MTIEKYFELYDNNPSGIYTTSKWLLNNVSEIYELISKKNGKTISEKAYCLRHNINIKSTCLNCGNDVKYKNKTIGYQKYCSNSCSATASKELAKKTLYKEYGVYHPSLIPKNIIKRKDKRIEVLKKSIGVAKLLNTSENEEYKIECDLCNKIHNIERKVFDQRLYLGLDWRNCISNSFSVSNGEVEIRNFIESIYKKDLVYNDRKLLGLEIDIFIPEFNLGIEYNGLYWHSEINKRQDYHYHKYKTSLDNDITLIQIYEDEWIYKKEIIKSRISNLLHLNKNKVYARNCTIKVIDFKTTNNFLNSNHLQGSIKSSINLGLYSNDELVSLMTFGKPRGNMSSKNNKSTYELYRFCNKLNTNVIGAGSKLFSYFIRLYKNVEYIYSFSANEWAGTFYQKIGMKYLSESKLSYWYIKSHKRVSRHNYNKGKLVKMGHDVNKSEHQILKELKIYRIYGAGNSKFIWER